MIIQYIAFCNMKYDTLMVKFFCNAQINVKN
jgi:hypothetical protein